MADVEADLRVHDTTKRAPACGESWELISILGLLEIDRYEVMILTPEQAYALILNLREPGRTLTLSAAGTGLRISECLGLQWQDLSFAEAVIHVRRTWTCGQVGLPKSKPSKGPVPLHPSLAEFMLC